MSEFGENGTAPIDASAAGVRVLLVDDHDLFRTGLRTLLEEQGVEIVGEAVNGDEAVRLVEEHAPDVVLMDLDMPGKHGIEATREIAAVAPLTRVVVLTISDQDADVMDAVIAGACGYLLKDATIQELLRGIAAASKGESLISPSIAAKVLQRVRATSPDVEAAEMLIRAELSDRELQVLKLIANGKDNAQIAGAALHQPEDGQEPHLEHPAEASASRTASRRPCTPCGAGSPSCYEKPGCGTPAAGRPRAARGCAG